MSHQDTDPSNEVLFNPLWDPQCLQNNCRDV